MQPGLEIRHVQFRSRTALIAEREAYVFRVRQQRTFSVQFNVSFIQNEISIGDEIFHEGSIIISAIFFLDLLVFRPLDASGHVGLILH